MEIKPIKVLLVEDNVAYSDVLRETLAGVASAQFDLAQCDRLGAALQRLREEHFHAVLLDLNLPDSQGLETFTQIREAAPAVPIIILTSIEDEALALQAIREGAQEYLVKGQIQGKMLARIVRYVVERRFADQALREREEFFRLISENVTDLIAVLDRNGKRLYNSPSYAKLLGDPGQLRGTISFVQIHPEDQERIKRIFEETVATGVGQRTEYRFLLPDGSIRFVESLGSVIQDEAGQVSKVVVVSRDMTEHRLAQERLRQSEVLYHSLVESLPQSIFRKDLEGRFTFVNQRFCAALGKTPEQVVGKTDYDFFPAELAAKYQTDDRRVIHTGQIFETIEEHQPPEGEKMYVHVVKIPVYDAQRRAIGMQGIFWDVTKERRAEEQQRMSEARLQAILDNSPAVIYLKDRQGRYQVINRRYEALFHITREQAANKSDFDLFPREIADAFHANDLKVLESGVPLEFEEAVPQDGELHTFISIKFPLFDGAGMPYAVCGISTDITERKRAEERLRHSEALYQSLVESLPQNIFRKDLAGRFTFVNQVFCNAWGKTVEEIIGKTDHDLFPPDLAEKYRIDDEFVIRTGEIFETVEEHHPTGGERVTAQVVKIPIYDANGRITGIQGIYWDITKQKRDEEKLRNTLAALEDSLRELKATQLQLIQAAKMESVGTLAAGVAHEVKNPLQTMLMGLDYLSRNTPPKDSTIAMVVTDMRDAVKRADNIVRGLLHYSAVHHTDMREEDFNAVLGHTLLLVNYELTRSRIKVVQELAPHLPPVRMDRTKMEQVFINLFMNAIHAMSEGGTLTIRTSGNQWIESAPPDGPRSHPFLPGDTIVIAEVQDAGTGIRDEDLPKIFDPFFTTKPTGVGTGLGLPVTKKIIELHGGTIDVNNVPAGGVRVTVTLKASKGAEHEQKTNSTH